MKIKKSEKIKKNNEKNRNSKCYNVKEQNQQQDENDPTDIEKDTVEAITKDTLKQLNTTYGTYSTIK